VPAVHHGRVLVDRGAELAVLEGVLEDALEGRARVLLLVGDAGVGKTALLAEVARMATDREARVVTVDAVEPERDIPGAAASILVAALTDVVDVLDPTTGARLRSTARGVVDGALPGALLELLATAAEAAPVVLLADDAQWWDPESLGSLMFAARRLSADDVLVLVACRASASDLAALHGIHRLDVSPMPRDAAAALVRAQATDIIPEVAAGLVETLGGNPFALLEAVAVLPERVRNGTEPLPDPVPVGRALSGRWANVLVALPDRTRTALAVLAAEGTGDGSVVHAAWESLGCSGDDLVPAEACHAVVLGTHGWTFPHPVVRASVFEALAPPERRRAHAALADALRDRDRDARFAHHLAASCVGVDEASAAELMHVADALADAGSAVAAATSAENAARLTPPGPVHAARLLRAAQLTLHARDEVRAAMLAEQGLALGAGTTVAAGFRRVLGVAVGHLRDSRRGARLLLEAAEGLEEVDRLGALVDALAFIKMWNDPDASRAVVAELGDLSELEPWMKLDVGTVLASGGAWSDALPLLEDGLRDVDPSAAEVSETACDAWGDAAAVVGLAAYADRYREAAGRLLDSGSVFLSAMGMSMQVELAYAEGRWSDAESVSAALRELDVAHGRFPQYEVGAEMRIAARRGDREAFDRLEAELLRVAPSAGLDILLANAQGLRAALHVALGEHELAEPLLRRVVDAAPPGMLVTTIVPSAAVTLVAQLARTGREEEATRIATDVVPRLSVQPSPLAHAYAERLLAHTSPDDEVDAHFRAASVWNETGMHAFEAARTRLEHAQWLRRRRRRSDAVDQLGPALAAFEQMGCLPWAELCREELRAAGLDVTRTDPYAASAVLTAQEKQVAEAAAEGLTNAAIARRMYLSPKTVELHLTHVYRKLAISGRSELVDLRDAAQDSVAR
jgi:DNA-binding CsgD family transcriptional regulator